MWQQYMNKIKQYNIYCMTKYQKASAYFISQVSETMMRKGEVSLAMQQVYIKENVINY